MLRLRTLLRRSSTAATSVGSAGGSVIYEGQRAVHEYLQMHYGGQTEVFPYATGAVDGLNFPKRCADEVVMACKSNGADPSVSSALDVGCAVGGAAFELARSFSTVDAVDYSQAFVSAAQAMQLDGQLTYSALVEGTRTSSHVARLPDHLSADDIAKVHFDQGDACALEELRDAGKLKPEGYDAVLASNLLCRLPKPRAFLSSCADWAVKPQGVLVLLTPFSWLDQWTAQDEWIGGGDSVSSDRLQAQMESLGFALASRTDVPFLIREHARKFQYGVSECTVWKRT
jgi:putative 4-mercaptohistidine N1-methyltranferase